MDEKFLKVPPTGIQQPECAGTLCTLVHHKGKAWRRRFCILKNACLYFYSDINADCASGKKVIGFMFVNKQANVVNECLRANFLKNTNTSFI